MTDVLRLLAQLRQQLRPDAPIGETEAWWTTLTLIDSELSFDQRHSGDEQAMMSRLHDALSHAIRSIREEWPLPSTSSAQVALDALQASIERRTTGVDGLPSVDRPAP
jgi:hypothetical protein